MSPKPEVEKRPAHEPTQDPNAPLDLADLVNKPFEGDAPTDKEKSPPA